VFSPYYASQRRYGWSDPENHCAMNVALYGTGGHKWAMTERGRPALHRDAQTLQIGPSSMSWNGTSLTVEVNEITAPFPSRIRGTIKLHPHAVTERAFPVDADASHRWWPIAPVARFEVQLENPSLRWSGSGYLDSNSGEVPLERTFKRWDWSRTVERDSTAVLYDVTGRNGDASSLAMRFDKDGTATDMELPAPARLPSTLWGVARSTRSDDGEARVQQTLEDGPFYSRSIISTRLDNAPVTAIHESLSLERFSRLWVQGLLPFKMPRRRGRMRS
jgi:carotenoid 1,2-hydratase